jgi:hypothetical protein
VLKDTSKKVVVLLQEIKKDTVADKMGELVLHKKMLMPRTMRTSFMETASEVPFDRDKYTAAHKKLPLELN